MTSERPILVLGAGINGAAVARELALNGIPVCVVDTADLAFGATAYSSRLIHGGLRYLEYGDFKLVRQALEERTRLLRLAPQFVRPLRLFIPVATRSAGLLSAAFKFCGWQRIRQGRVPPRGLWLVRAGLWLYDWYAKSSSLPRRGVHRVDGEHTPPVDTQTYRWLCSYYDAQMPFPERFVVALLDDARRLADEQQIPFDVYTYHRAELDGRLVRIRALPRREGADDRLVVAKEFEPAAIINATGAWVDRTLTRLAVPSPQLIGGTKGSHFLTTDPRLREMLNGNGVYVEAADGRPIFLLPLDDWTLVGTTDLPFTGSPETAEATEAELDYLLAAANSVFPQLELTRDSVEMHYSGVRPLPFASDRTPAAVTRSHRIEQHNDCDVPLYSIIGGKLTTCRAVAEEMARIVSERIGGVVRRNSRERTVPGGADYPENNDDLTAVLQQLSASLNLNIAQVRAAWRLAGSRAVELLTPGKDELPDADDLRSLTGTDLPLCLVRRVLQNEWVTRLSDLVERRLMLLYDRRLSRESLTELAQLMAEQGLIGRQDIESEVTACVERLRSHFGRKIVGSVSKGDKL